MAFNPPINWLSRNLRTLDEDLELLNIDFDKKDRFDDNIKSIISSMRHLEDRDKITEDIYNVGKYIELCLVYGDLPSSIKEDYELYKSERNEHIKAKYASNIKNECIKILLSR